jgi:transcriptional regulator of PTS gene
MRVSDHEHIRLQVLKAILRTGPLARSQLAAETGLAAGTITQITGDLLRRKMIVEERVAASVGRPRVNLRIDAAGAYAVAAVLLPDGTLPVQIVNLRGEPVASFSGRISATSFAALAEQIAAEIEQALAKSPIARIEIRHVGIGLPALVDSRAGIVRWLQTFAGRDYPMAREIEQRLELPVTIDSASNLLARAEHWFGKSEQLDSFSMIVIGLGISSARYVKGSLWSGANGLSPEFAHVKVQGGTGRSCTCGASGCIEAYASLWALSRQLAELDGKRRPADLIGELNNLSLGAAPISDEARSIIGRAADLLGIAISNHINSADPGRVLIVADDRLPSDLMLPDVIRAIERDTLPAILSQTLIESRLESRTDTNKGAAAVVLEQLYMRH